VEQQTTWLIQSQHWIKIWRRYSSLSQLPPTVQPTQDSQESSAYEIYRRHDWYTHQTFTETPPHHTTSGLQLFHSDHQLTGNFPGGHYGHL
jgi:hypothetical protein